MNRAQLVLQYLETILSPQIVVGVVVTVFILLFRKDLRALMARIAKIRLPGGSELFATQLERAPDEKTKDEKPAPVAASVDLPDNLSLTPEQVEIIRNFVLSEKANAALWEYRYLNYFLVIGTQRVLDWLAALESGTSLSLFSNFWHPLIPNPSERSAILGALETHCLIKVTGEYIEITPKGREYVQWRGTAPRAQNIGKD